MRIDAGHTPTTAVTGSAGPEHMRGYRPELDVVRFLAFSLVFLHHYLPRNPVPVRSSLVFSLVGFTGWRILTSFANACAMGLCLFFALSAYLITELLFEERSLTGSVSVRKFYIRRALRIWPLYVFGIAIGIALAVAGHRPQDITEFMWYLLFVGNVYAGAFGWSENPMMVLWSISIEEQFYLIWPWAMRWLSRRALIMCAALLIIAANIRLFSFGQRHADTDITVWTNTFVQFEMFATGILLSLAGKRVIRGNFGTGLLLAIAGPVLWFFACFAFHVKEWGEAGFAASGTILMVGYGLVAIGCAAVLHGFSIMGPSRMWHWATDLGRISYGLYVYHMLAGYAALALIRRLPILGLPGADRPMAILFTIIAARLSYSWLESPFLRLKKRFEIVHSKPV